MKTQVLSSFVQTRPWLWAFIGAVLVWFSSMMMSRGQGGMGMLLISLQFATFYVLVALGQMLVISCGSGNIDLSIPGVMTLAAYIGLGTAHSTNGAIPVAILAVIGVGVGCGVFNLLLIQALKIPPMIATLASAFVTQSLAIAYSRGASPIPPPLLTEWAGARWFHVPLLAVAVMVLAAVIALWLKRSLMGRTLLATGQNIRAAVLTDLPVKRALITAYLASTLFASLAGLLLASFVGGATLDLGQDYQLMSIACVILGGTAVSGGYATPLGVWFSALLLVLTVSMLNIMQVSPGTRYLVTGLIIVTVLAVARKKA
ncbi:ABC transporter permease [Sodalis ligni]|jgi:ribose transport system permease protein|uniref:Autoinducer 2 import system permease protein LsrD n=1 Tax=Sodalis ligni TaxID=2697027 RepID=A0A4R1N796_9GAMM|nr:ABC transporter permease [Sodalis ligni]TCL03154.1 monosaccharide ABC transporter membrane protein (CUT2 family) [Sodalis ligni]